MKWEEFKNIDSLTTAYDPREKTNIECPECGKKLWRRTDIVLTSYPAQYQYECDCGWVGYAFR